jgi:hypothetical protein
MSSSSALARIPSCLNDDRRVMTIVYRPYRPKRAQKRKAQAAAITGPTIVTAKSKLIRRQTAEAVSNEPAQSAIVTAKNPRRGHGRFGDAEDMTPEEHKRRGDAADALFREMKRQIAEKMRERK